MRVAWGWRAAAAAAFWSWPTASQETTAQSVDVRITPDTDFVDLFANLGNIFDQDPPGCSGRGVTDAYVWRPCGYGSNMMMLLIPWVNGIIRGRKPLAIIEVEGGGRHMDEFNNVQCADASNGVQTDGGWSCLFGPMPNACKFHTLEDWGHFMGLRGANDTAVEEAIENSGVYTTRTHYPYIQETLEGSGIDATDAFAAVLQYFHSYRQPWLKRDIISIIEEDEITELRSGPFISMHVRRGDKLVHEAKRYETEDYMAAAVAFLDAVGSDQVDGIRGIYLASDDYTVFPEVQKIAPLFFPNVDPARIIWISSRAEMVFDPDDHLRDRDNLATASYQMTYEMNVVMFTELEMLSRAQVFVGTFSSSFSRIAHLMRVVNGFARNSSISLD